MQVVLPGGQICNLSKYRRLVAKIGTNANCITCWPNFQPMQVAFYTAGVVSQALDVIPWVRCASGNVLSSSWTIDKIP